ncbi:Basic region leucine zipper [Teratosphaeria destructans]|uniref:Basic region leucine zipper n=1 Tax=Teratosphaeria destructans TaxID=418781 RepID=A0A9W7SZL5_9PEZI|nr:Basic region leucine zipper [Teratosphaeria destructans]
MGVKAEPNVAYHSTFGDLSSSGGGGFTSEFTAVDSALGPTVSPKDIFNTDSVPPSTSFTNLTTPGSTYLDTPDDSFETSPMYESFDTSKTWSSLFPEEDVSFAPSMARTTSASSASQIVVHPGGESLQRKRSSATNSPATFSPAVKHSSVAGVNARKRDKPLPPILVDENDPVALKRARNTAAARKSRAKKVLERDDLETQIANLKAEVEKYKSLARAHGAEVDEE